MTNTKLLNEYIIKAGIKKGSVASALGISRQAFNSKCCNKSEFKASEIETLCSLLKIGAKDKNAIFFAK